MLLLSFLLLYDVLIFIFIQTENFRDVEGSSLQSVPMINSLNKLKICYCDMTDESAISLLTYLCTSFNKMECLDLKGNGLTDEVVDQICQFLQNSKTLTFLGLERNRITDDGVAKLVEDLNDNHALKHLRLAENPFKSKGIQYLSSKYLKCKKLLTSLSLSVESDEDFSHLCDDLKENESLEELTFGLKFSNLIERLDIRLSDLTFSNLIEVLKKHKNLVKLQFSNHYNADDIFKLQCQFLDKTIGFI